MTALSLQTRAPSGKTPGRPLKPKRQSTKRITLRQAESMMAALAFAREVGTPLNAHATVHWVGTEAGDDPDGYRFAKLR